MQDNSPRRNHRGLCTYEGNKMWNYEILGTDIYHLLAAFVLYSILGWALESTYMSFCNHKLTNRGFGKGPFCPIYGFGGVHYEKPSVKRKKKSEAARKRKYN